MPPTSSQLEKLVFQNIKLGLPQPNYSYSIVWIMGVWAMILFSIIALKQFPGLYWIWSIPMAIGMLGAAIGIHECAHQTLVKGKRATAVLGYLFGIFSLQPFQSYQRGHFAHHRWQGTSKDPTPTPLVQPPSNQILDILLLIQLPILYWGGVWWPYFIYSLKTDSLFSKNGMLWVGGLIFLGAPHLILSISLDNYTLLILISFLLYSVGYERFFTLSQHLGLRPKVKKERYTPLEQVQQSRSIRYALDRTHLFFGLHKEHHLFPQLHWSQLLPLHRELKTSHPELFNIEDEHLGAAVRRKGTLQNILWKPDTNK